MPVITVMPEALAADEGSAHFVDEYFERAISRVAWSLKSYVRDAIHQTPQPVFRQHQDS